MTDDRMALVELLQKSGDGDFLRAVAEVVLQILMEADIEGLIGPTGQARGAERPRSARTHPATGSIIATAIASAASTPASARSS